MAKQAREAMKATDLTVVADRGYFSGVELLACQQEGIRALVPEPRTSNKRLRGLFTKDDFRNEPEQDQYRCPAGEALSWRFTTLEHGLSRHLYFSTACTRCAIKGKCTTSVDYRRIRRWEHAVVVDAALEDLAQHPETIGLRKQTVAHPFGTIKSWMGATHFLTRTLNRVQTEMRLHVLAYNMKRVVNLLGVIPLTEALRT